MALSKTSGIGTKINGNKVEYAYAQDFRFGNIQETDLKTEQHDKEDGTGIETVKYFLTNNVGQRINLDNFKKFNKEKYKEEVLGKIKPNEIGDPEKEALYDVLVKSPFQRYFVDFIAKILYNLKYEVQGIPCLFKGKIMKKVHNYTSNLELTSLLIRIKNLRALDKQILTKEDYRNNRRLNRYIKVHTKINDTKSTPENASKRAKLKDHLKEVIISLSEKTPCDQKSYNRFGQIVLLMVKKILTRPQFNGYSYKDDFYSDASFKILKYLGNFDHTLISERTGQRVNAFAYITQIIMNSIIAIINTRKRDYDNVMEQIKLGIIDNPKASMDTRNLYIKDKEYTPEPEKIDKQYFLNGNPDDVIEELSGIIENNGTSENINTITIHIENDVEFNIDQYNLIKNLAKSSKVPVILGERFKEDENVQFS